MSHPSATVSFAEDSKVSIKSIPPTRISRVVALNIGLLSGAAQRMGLTTMDTSMTDAQEGATKGFRERLETLQTEVVENPNQKAQKIEVAAIRALTQRIDELKRELTISKVTTARTIELNDALRRENERLVGDVTNMLADRDEVTLQHGLALGSAQSKMILVVAKARVAAEEALEKHAEDDAAARAAVSQRLKHTASSAMGGSMDPAASALYALNGVAVLLEAERRTTKELREELLILRQNRSASEILLHTAIMDASSVLAIERAAVFTAKEIKEKDKISSYSRAALLADILHKEEILKALPKVVFLGTPIEPLAAAPPAVAAADKRR